MDLWLRFQGDPPRRILRFEPAVPTEHRLVIRWHAGIGLVDGPCPIERLTILCQATRKVSSDIALSVAVEEVDIENAAELTPGTRRGAEEALAKFQAFARETRFSDRGAYDGGPRFMALTRLLESVFRCPLPFESVGIGAQWEAQAVVDDLRLPLTETIRYHLVALSDETLEIGFRSAGAVADLDPPRIRRGGEIVRGVERKWSASGSMKRDLRSAHPSRFQQESKWEALDLVRRRGKTTREGWFVGEKIFADAQVPESGKAR